MKNRIVLLTQVITFFFFGIVDNAQGQTINVCYDGDTSISLLSYCSDWTYQWEKKNASSSTWNVAGVGTQLLLFNVIHNTDVRCSADTNDDGVYDSIVHQVNVAPFAQLSAAQITGNGLICYNSPSPAQTISIPASGGGDAYSYQWQYSINSGASWSNIPGATQTTLAPQTLIANRSYRLLTTSSIGCGQAYSNTTLVAVHDELIAPVIATNSSTVCYDSIPDSLTIISNPDGGVGGFSYQWQLLSGGTYNNIAGATASSYLPSALREATTYRLAATNDCGTVYSQPLQIDVYPLLAAGTLMSEQTICYNSPVSLTFVQNPTGGAGQYTYQWQSSSDNTNWNDISGAIQNAYTTPSLTNDIYYRVRVGSTPSCSEETTNSCFVSVLPQVTAGTIDGQTTICYSNTPDALTMVHNATGGGGNYSYQWQQSVNGTTWTDISSATSTNYQPSSLMATTYYRLRQNSTIGCGSVNTNTIAITVLPDITAATIATNATATLCYDSVPSDVTVAVMPIGADGMFSYQWQERTDGTWDNIEGAINTTYQPSALREGHSYRLISTSNFGCGSRTSNEVTISVYPRINAGVIDDQLICHNTSASFYFSTTPSGGGNSYTYQWQQSADGALWSDIASTSSANYTTPNLTDTMDYRVIVSSALGCSSDTTEVARVSVLPIFTAGTIGHDTSICYNTSAGVLTIITDATGGLPPYAYQWQCSTNTTDYTDLTSQTGTSYYTSNMQTSSQYRLKYISQNGCAPVYSDPINITVYNDITAATIATTATATLCFDSVPSDVNITVMPSGADGMFSYQWQERTCGTWGNIEGAITNTYQPSALREDHSYRLISTSTYGCGSRTSNEVTINVYPRIIAGVIDDQLICYNTSASMYFSTAPSGGGNIYTYQWQQSADGSSWNDITIATLDNYTSNQLSSTTKFRVIVTSVLGCSADTTEDAQVTVLPQLIAGTLESAIDSVCYGYKPTYNITMLSDATGGMEPYTYQWQVSTDGTTFVNAPHSDGTTFYQPDNLYQTTYYQLLFTSSYNCGTVASNIHTIRVDPLPEPFTIVGEAASCYGQYETYTLPTATDTYSYQWGTLFGTGTIFLLSDLADSVEILWEQPQVQDSILVLVTNNRTGCYSTSSAMVQTSLEEAPERTTIVHKPGSNILVAREDRNYYYTWGYTDLHTKQQVYIENSNRRYVLLPIPYDTLSYDYWLEVRKTADSPCYSISHYNPSDDFLIIVPESPKLTVINVSRQRISITVSNTDDKPTQIVIYDLLGRTVYESQIPPLVQSIIVDLPERGIFVVKATPKGSQPMMEKIVVK